MQSDVVSSAACYRLRLPLALPYRWRGGLIEHFDAVLVVVGTDGGRSGIGEGTPVAGYSFETLDDAWGYATQLVSTLRGRSVGEVLDETRRHATRHPFGCAAVRGALEGAVHQARPGPTSVDPPVIGTVRPGPDLSEVDAALQLVDDGFTVLKLKIGNSVEQDIERIRTLQQHVRGAYLRLDANQGYTRTEATQFLTLLDPELIELVEQPLARDDWEGQARLHAGTDVPLMLDESIWTDEDIYRAADVADVVKLKVMKSGGPDVARHQARLAQQLGLTVVIGNGVATEIDAVAEARVHLQTGLNLPGEFNGFAKQAAGLTLRPLTIEGGALKGEELTADPELNMTVVERHCTERFCAS